MLRDIFRSESFSTTILSCLAQIGAKHLQDEAPFHVTASRHVRPLQQKAEKYLELDLWSPDIISTLLPNEDAEHLTKHQGISCAADATLCILGNDNARRNLMAVVGYIHNTRDPSQLPTDSVDYATHARHPLGPHPFPRPEFRVVGMGCWPSAAGALVPD